MSFLDKAKKKVREKKSEPPKPEPKEMPPPPPPPPPEPKEAKPVPIVLPKYPQIVEYVEKWKQVHQGSYKSKCTVCGEEYQTIVDKCKNKCVAYTKTTKKRKKTTIQSYWEEIWPYEKTFLRNPRQWKGLIQSILEISEMIMND